MRRDGAILSFRFGQPISVLRVGFLAGIFCPFRQVLPGIFCRERGGGSMWRAERVKIIWVRSANVCWGFLRCGFFISEIILRGKGVAKSCLEGGGSAGRLN